MSKISRRKMLSVAGLLGSGVIASQTGCGSAGSGLISSAQAAESSAEITTPPRYVPVSPEKVAAVAHDLFPDGTCMYAVMKSVITTIAEKDPSAVPSFYFDMFKYGHGGCGGWGTLCGTLNGGAAVLGMFYLDKAERDGLIGELFRWYESTELPEYIPSGAKEDDIPKSQSDSVLCHISVDTWCAEAEKGPRSPERKERCARLSGDVARKVVTILNAKHAEQKKEQSTATTKPSPHPELATQPPQTCIQCHSTPGGEEGSDAARAPKILGKMDCSMCHDMNSDHPN